LLGGELYVKKATLEYHASAVMDDDLSIGMKCSKLGNSSMVFQAGIFRGDKLLVSGELIYVFADPQTQTSKPIPEALRHILLIYEAGQPVVDLKMGSWSELKTMAAALRHEVFVDEQEVPVELELDELDDHACMLWCLTNSAKAWQQVACCSLKPMWLKLAEWQFQSL